MRVENLVFTWDLREYWRFVLFPESLPFFPLLLLLFSSIQSTLLHLQTVQPLESSGNQRTTKNLVTLFTSRLFCHLATILPLLFALTTKISSQYLMKSNESFHFIHSLLDHDWKWERRIDERRESTNKIKPLKLDVLEGRSEIVKLGMMPSEVSEWRSRFGKREREREGVWITYGTIFEWKKAGSNNFLLVFLNTIQLSTGILSFFPPPSSSLLLQDEKIKRFFSITRSSTLGHPSSIILQPLLRLTTSSKTLCRIAILLR